MRHFQHNLNNSKACFVRSIAYLSWNHSIPCPASRINESYSALQVFKLSTEDIFDRKLIKRIRQQGFSEVPVYIGSDEQHILGVLRTKNLLLAEEKHMHKKIGKRFPLEEPLMVAQDTSMLEMLMLFQEKKQTMAFISTEDKKKGVKGSEALLFDVI